MGLEFDYVFLSTLSLRRATTGRQSPALGVPYFYPRSPCGERHLLISQVYTSVNFYPRSPCGERRVGPWPCGPARIISIHALLAESDQEYIIRNVEALIFLSTLSLRRATSGISAILTNLDDFYPRSPCGERPLVTTHADLYVCISIHALLAESDIHPPKVDTRTPISIHALLAESDRIAAQTVPAQTPISIHALLAESDAQPRQLRRCLTEFLSTLSLRRATSQILALLCFYRNFYPRSPCGERQRCIYLEYR